MSFESKSKELPNKNNQGNDCSGTYDKRIASAEHDYLPQRPQSSFTMNLEPKIGSEDRIEMPCSNPQIRFYKSVIRPDTVKRTNEEYRALPVKEKLILQQEIEKLQKRTSFVCKVNKTNNELVRKLSLNPYSREKSFRRQNTVEEKKKVLRKKIVKQEAGKVEENVYLDIGNAEETKVFVDKVSMLLRSKKRCAAQTDMLKTYQKLVNYIP